jgi:hypothetical protein
VSISNIPSQSLNVLDAQELLQAAADRTGLTDFGPADFMAGFIALVNGLNTDANIRADRWNDVRERVLRLLLNRLWFAKDLTEHPEILDEDLGSPVVITSLPRTASTKLHRMLGASGEFQVLPLWKAHMFARIPGHVDGGNAQRIQTTREYERWAYEVSPTMLTGHPIFTEEPEEDMLLGEFTFRHPFVIGVFNSPSYMQWLMQADMKPAYDYLGAQLKYLQWQNPGERKKPWLLKTPIHFGNEHRLVDLFGNARFVVTHRDPAKCIPSIASTTLGWRAMYTADGGTTTAGNELSAMFAHGAANHMQWRDNNPDIAVLDIGFDEMNADALGAIRRVFDFLGMELPSTAETAMLTWEKNNGREKHGKHSYSAEQVGTTEADIRNAFQQYTRRFEQFI